MPFAKAAPLFPRPNLNTRIQQMSIRKYIILGDSGILPLIFLKIGNMPLFANYIGAYPCFDTRLP